MLFDLVLSWLFAEPDGEKIRRIVSRSDRVVVSNLTLVECDRTIIRATVERRLAEAEAQDLHALLASTARRWSLMRLDDEVLSRARRPFALEPLRALDALHLASALIAREGAGAFALLSLDRRLREAARHAGLAVAPA